MECDICLLEWDSSERIPRLLSCGHTFCQLCLKSFFLKSKNQNKPFSCPTCHTSQDIIDECDILKLIKNFNLLRIAEKIETRKTIVSSSHLNNSRICDALLEGLNDFNQSSNANIPIMHTGSLKDPPKKSGTLKTEHEINKSNINIELDQKCKKHGLPIHSYAIGTNLLFCDSCIAESNLRTYPLPNIINEIKRKIDQNQIKACLTKNEIQRLQVFFELYLYYISSINYILLIRTEFEKANSAKIENLFNYFYKIIKYFHNDAKQMLNQCLSEQKTQLNQRLTELRELNDELSTMEDDLTKLNSASEGDMLKEIEKIRKIQQRLKNYINYNLEFDLLLMKIGINNEAKENLLTSIQKAYHIDVEFLQIQNERPSINQILKVANHWSCICGELNNSLNDIRCSSCSLFRRIETIPDIYLNPGNVTAENVKLFNLRKKEEAKDFQNLIKANSHNDKWYALAIEWYLQWKCFITNDQTDKYISNNKKRISVNKMIGVLPPGPIYNGFLIEMSEKDNRNNGKEIRMRKGLKKNDDYIIITEAVWHFFFLNYNGGPAIVLNGNDNIYSCFVKSNGIEYRSYSSIKDEFIDEQSITEKKQSNPEIDFDYDYDDNMNSNDDNNFENQQENK